MLKLKKCDFLLIAAVLLAAGMLWGYKWLGANRADYAPGELHALITVNGETWKTVPLTGKERIIDIRTEYGHNTLKVYDYGIRMIYSDAPKRIALDMGFISKPYQQIICVPTRVMVQVLRPGGPEADGLDAVI
ncbi:NusG domain II-containing protein [Paenibacillus sp. CN-4]|uniref:NusG domain II-containing protein n=1 Tax=Paenibacillus nanchangensis TaxID=3348343 RepID=UPI00397D1ECD